MGLVIMMVGLPGCGKTKQAEELAEIYDAKIFSSEDFRVKYPELNENEIFEKIFEESRKILSKKQNCIIDSTNISKHQRKKCMEALQGNTFMACVIKASKNFCKMQILKRNHEGKRYIVPFSVIDLYSKNFEMPTEEEGFSDIIFIKTEQSKYSKQERFNNQKEFIF